MGLAITEGIICEEIWEGAREHGKSSDQNVHLTAVQKGGKERGLGSLRLQNGSRKFWPGRWGVIKPKLHVRGVLHLLGMGKCPYIRSLVCSVIGRKQHLGRVV